MNEATVTVLPVVSPADLPVPERLHFIDGLRALAALFVVLCHSYYEPADGFYREPYMSHLFLTYGRIAVVVFIVVSGYCLMLPVAKRNGDLGPATKFFKKRALRILPPYLAALVLCSLYIVLLASKKTGTVWDSSLPFSMKSFFVHLFMLQDFRFIAAKLGHINYVFWSIAIEWQIYFFMPLIVVLFRRFNGFTVAAVAAVIGVSIHFMAKGYFDSNYPWYIALFMFGCVSAQQSVEAPNQSISTLRTISTSILIGVAGVILLKGHSFFMHNLPEMDIAIGAVTAIVLYCLYSDRDAQGQIVTRVLSYGPLVAVGEFSYSLYLVHPPVLHVLDRIFWRLFHLPSIPMFLTLVVCLPIVLAAAYVFHLLFERPFMRRNAAMATDILAPVKPSVRPVSE